MGLEQCSVKILVFKIWHTVASKRIHMYTEKDKIVGGLYGAIKNFVLLIVNEIAPSQEMKHGGT